MNEIIRKIEEADIEWEMEWADGRKETMFEESPALALLLINEVVFINGLNLKSDFPEEAQKGIYLGVNCSDVFAWGCSDLEQAGYADIEDIYQMWKKDPVWGPSVWTIIKRQQMPQKPVEDKIREQGVWDLDALQKEHSLLPNYYDGISRVLSQRKYDTYALWKASRGEKPLPWGKGWWDGWRDYLKAHPDCFDENWKRIDDGLIRQWRQINGYGEI